MINLQGNNGIELLRRLLMNARYILMLSVIFASSGQVLFKKGMMALGAQSLTTNPLGLLKAVFNILLSPMVFSGLLLYVLSTLLWLFALSKTTLNYAYPFTALTFILVMAASYFIFREALPLNRIIGGAVVCAGIILSSYK
jgi:drug/metabolite transporter (DMT)-like permease